MKTRRTAARRSSAARSASAVDSACAQSSMKEIMVRKESWPAGERIAVEVADLDRRQLGQRLGQRLAVAHDDDGEMVRVQVLAGDAADVVLRDGRDLLGV